MPIKKTVGRWLRNGVEKNAARRNLATSISRNYAKKNLLNETQSNKLIQRIAIRPKPDKDDSLPLFMVKKQVFVWIVTGRKTIEVREGKAKKGDDAVFQCGRKVLRGKITKKEEGSLTDILRQDNYKNIIPLAKGLEEAIIYLKGLYGTAEGTFTAYNFDLKKSTIERCNVPSITN